MGLFDASCGMVVLTICEREPLCALRGIVRPSSGASKYRFHEERRYRGLIVPPLLIELGAMNHGDVGMDVVEEDFKVSDGIFIGGQKFWWDSDGGTARGV